MAAATVTAVAAVVSAGAAVSGSINQSRQIRSAQRKADDMEDARQIQADSILDQIDAEQDVLADELEFITKGTTFAEKTLLSQTTKSMDVLQSTAVEAIDSTFGGMIESGAGQRARSKIGETYESTLQEAKDDWNLGMESIALKDEEAQRQAEDRHDEIVSALEQQREDLLAMT